MIYKLDGIVFDINVEHKFGDVNYPALWFLDRDNRAALGITEEPDPIPIPKTQNELDYIRFLNRASSRDSIIAWMAADNMKRVRGGLWTVDQLVSLTQDAQLKEILDDVNTLSYEIAYAKMDYVVNPLLTLDIKDSWKAKLYANFYL